MWRFYCEICANMSADYSIGSLLYNDYLIPWIEFSILAFEFSILEQICDLLIENSDIVNNSCHIIVYYIEMSFIIYSLIK